MKEQAKLLAFRAFELGDSVALSLIALLAFVLTGVVWVFRGFLRRERNLDTRDLEALMSEEPAAAEEPQGRSWERPADWWKQ